MNPRAGAESKPATAARIYDYVLGGVHNFPADREAAKVVLEQFPLMPAWARANRAALRRIMRYLAKSGVRQFLDIGSGMPTEGNVHEIAQEIAPDAKVIYTDIDPIAVSEGLEILDGNPNALAINGDLRRPQEILDNPQVQQLLDFSQPIAVLLMAVVHFVPDDAEASAAIKTLLAGLPAGSYLAMSHVATEGIELWTASEQKVAAIAEVYENRTSTPGASRTREQISEYFKGTTLVEPGIAWLPDWRPEPDDPTDFADDSRMCAAWVAVGRLG
jgi:hypothetical protein